MAFQNQPLFQQLQQQKKTFPIVWSQQTDSVPIGAYNYLNYKQIPRNWLYA